ncbi:MAG: carotenoid 1,2-hydratase [Phycisphaerales bacterium]|jgi:hypothetical protein|nr:carotenoid 1,2-hydratase [Phycisphaerales bacterium]
MPTLPMMTPTPHADASRKITAPGGYEWWRFDASSDDGKLHLVAGLHFGHAFDRRYLRRYAMYRRFPTRVRPPAPAEFCAVTFALLERGRPALRLAMPIAKDEFSAADDGRTVRLGASHMNRGPDGVLRLHLRGLDDDRTIAVNLSFRPQLNTSCDVDLASASAADAGQHRWVVVDPLCDVDGEISVFAESGGPPRVTPFAGSGCHDHRFGTRPLGALGHRWLNGRAVFADRAILFHQVGDAAFVWQAGGKGATPAATSGGLKVIGSATSRWGIGYPETIELPGAGDVRLMRPRVVGTSFASVIVAYDAAGDLETGRALVQVLKPRRLVWGSR